MSIVSDPLSRDPNPTYSKAVRRLQVLELEKKKLIDFIDHIGANPGYSLACQSCSTLHVIPLCEKNPEAPSALPLESVDQVKCLICGAQDRPSVLPYKLTMEGKANANAT